MLAYLNISNNHLLDKIKVKWLKVLVSDYYKQKNGEDCRLLLEKHNENETSSFELYPVFIVVIATVNDPYDRLKFFGQSKAINENRYQTINSNV